VAAGVAALDLAEDLLEALRRPAIIMFYEIFSPRNGKN
jgi:hypothetical protein